ncbi:MAG: CHASE2 domain-containing protein, partial [Terriglobia bacterium]
MATSLTPPGSKSADATSARKTEPKRPARQRPSGRLWFVGAALASAALSWGLSSVHGFQLWGLSSISGFQLLELTTYDLRMIAPYNLRWLLRIEQPPPSDIAVVMLDARTERAFPDDPRIFWHPHFASLLRAAAEGEARAVGLDISFGLSVEKWAPDYDRQLAEAFAEVSASIPVVLAYDSLQELPESLPLYLLATTQGAIGYANLTTDPDSS